MALQLLQLLNYSTNYLSLLNIILENFLYPQAADKRLWKG